MIHGETALARAEQATSGALRQRHQQTGRANIEDIFAEVPSSRSTRRRWLAARRWSICWSARPGVVRPRAAQDSGGGIYSTTGVADAAQTAPGNEAIDGRSVLRREAAIPSRARGAL
jgi:hypothetical protein